MPDSDNTYLRKIADSCRAIQEAFSGQPVPLPEDMNVTVTNFPPVQEVSVNNFPEFPPGFNVQNFPLSFQVSNFPAFPSSFAVTNFPASFQVSNFPSEISVNNFPATQNVAVQNFPVTQPVSAAALPLPAGAATEATLLSILARMATTNYGKTVNYFSLAQGAAGTVAIAAASPGNRHKVVGFMVTLAANGTVQFLSNATALTGQMDILARGNLQDPVSVLEPTFQTAVGEALNLTSVGGGAKGYIAYLTEP